MADGPRHRLYVDPPLTAGQRLTLPPEPSHYLCRVLRLRRGDRVLVFCGDGNGFDGEIAVSDTRACEITVGILLVTEPPAAFELHLAQSLIKGDRLDFVVQKATELGATRLTLVSSDRSEVHHAGARVERRLQHWRRVITAAAEQCGRLRLPAVIAPTPLRELLDAESAPQKYLLDPGAPPLGAMPDARDTVVLVGPEGGFSDSERALAISKGFVPIGLGSRILRADTAPVAALAILRQAWSWQQP